MAEKQMGNQAVLGERLIHCIYRMLQVIKLHQLNNRMLQKTLAEFKDVLWGVWQNSPTARLRILRGRFYLNDVRVTYSPSMWATAIKMIELLQGLRLSGLSFSRRDDLMDERIIGLLTLLNLARREPDSFSWLKEQARLEYPWVEFLEYEDTARIFTDAEAEEAAAAGWNAISMPPEMVAAEGRLAYAHALTAMLNLTNKLGSRNKAGIQKAKRALQELIEILYAAENIILILSTVRQYDEQIHTHSLNVALLAMALGRRLGLSKRAVEHLGLAGLFHDLGKLGLPMEILNKETSLSTDEMALVQGHALESVRQLIRLNINHRLKGRLARPAFEHHLGLELDGYPRADRWPALSLFSRIIAVVDQYDALTSNRPYRAEPLSPDQAMIQIYLQAGRTLDPLIVRLFISLLGPWPVGTLLLLDDGRAALSAGAGPAEDVEGQPWARFIFQEAGQVVAGDLVNLAEGGGAAPGYKLNIKAAFHPSPYGLQPANYLM